MEPDNLYLAALILLAAVIYTSVGHAGASGYIAAMALFGVAPAVMKPTALVLNILVASFGTWRLHRARLISTRALVPFIIGSLPFAFLGGAVQLPGGTYRLIVGMVLLGAAIPFLLAPRERVAHPEGPAPVPPVVPAILIGAAIGFLSGLTGTGGGIFLSPILLYMAWAGTRQSSGLTAPFILINSMAGLAGNAYSLAYLPPALPMFAVAALIGALIGTQLGIRWLSPRTIQRVLACVLIIAGGKLILT